MNPDTDPATASSALNTVGVTANGALCAYKNLGLNVLSSCIAAYNAILTNSQYSAPAFTG
jgi:hypothetical protein